MESAKEFEAQPSRATVLVTGIGGYLASHIGLDLVRRGCRVRGSLRSLSRAEPLLRAIRAQPGADRAVIEFFEAQLIREEGWQRAIAGCDYVVHAASPFPAVQPKNQDELIGPARDGTLRVLRHARAAGARRVVMTSSLVATNYGPEPPPHTEEHWTDIANPRCTPYHRSKTLAEQAAWRYSREQGLELAVINPGLILGPALLAECGTSVDMVLQLLRGKVPATPKMDLAVVDVRDVAEAHWSAMVLPAAAGQRFVTGGHYLRFIRIAEMLREAYPAYRRRLPRREIPDALVRLLARFDPRLRTIVGELGRDGRISNEKARRVLGWVPRPVSETVRDTARSLIDLQLI